MKTMTLDDLVKNPLTEEDKKIINSAKPVITRLPGNDRLPIKEV